MDNQQIATIFEEIGNLLEIDGANHFRVLAYQNAAENLRGLGREVRDIWKENPAELENLPGIGEDLRLKIEEMLTTGVCKFHLKLLKKYGRGILDILQIRGIGPKKVALFYHQLGIDNLEKLKAAALAHQLRELPRMGEKSENEILVAIEEHAKHSLRMLLSEALPLAEQIVAYIRKCPEVARVEYAGSLRRRKETVGDLDILAAPKNPAGAEKIISWFQKFPLIKNIIAGGPTKCSVILENGTQSDLRVVEIKSFGAALHYFTGSKDHNVEIRTIAQKGDLKINEYGIFDLHQKDRSGKPVEKFIIGDTEENFYKAVGLTYIPPVLRETRGEFKAALAHSLPQLVETEDLQGDLNINSNYGTGQNTLEEICRSASDRQLSYVAFADTFTAGELPSPFDDKKLSAQLKEISRLASKFPQLHIFKSVKLPVNTDGTLDLPPSALLNQLDFLTVKIMHNFNLIEPRQTARVLKALAAHPKVKLISCPNGRILNQREVIAVNIEKIITACAHSGQILEINSQPDHLDLADFQIKLAVEKKARLAINSDLRSIDQFDFLKYGVWTAQRGWAEKKNILNAQPLKFVLNALTGK
jgi:DNA polymerase (family 10)